MNHENKTKKAEQEFRTTLFYYRLRIGIVVMVLMLIPVIGGMILLPHFREATYVPPTYPQLDPNSKTYWVDRTLADIESHRNTNNKTDHSQLHFSLMNTLAAAQKVSSTYARTMAIADIAITMAKNDIDINIDDIIKELGDTPLATSIRTRIIASQSLMYVRLSKRSAARVAVQEYDRIVIEADIKLNTPTNELAFLGIITTLACLEDTVKLSDLFRKQIEFSLRTTMEQRMRAYRLIAGEQARVGMLVDAMNTVSKIRNLVERVRAYQLIMIYAARPPKMVPVEPSFFLPPVEGPWEALTEPVMARQIVGDIIRQIVDSEELEDQIDLLTMLSESRVMCDPEIYRLFRAGIADQVLIEDLVRRPILQQLDNPRSELIRASLNLPPRPSHLQQNIDPVLDDWESPNPTISIGVKEMESLALTNTFNQQKIHAWLMTAQCYQLCGRYSEAVQILRQAAAVSRDQKQSTSRIQTLLKIGERLFGVGSITEAHSVLKEVGLPSAVPATSAQETSTQPIILFTPDHLSVLARLQIVGRFFDEALATIRYIEPPLSQVPDLVFLAREQLRIGHFDEAAKTISAIADNTQAELLQHLSAIAQGGGEEHYLAAKIPFPDNLQTDEDLQRCCELLIQNGLFGVAVTAAQKMRNAELQSQNLARLVREHILLFRAYGEDGDWHRSIRVSLLEAAYAVAKKIVQPISRAESFEVILAAVLPYYSEADVRDFLFRVFDEALAISRRIETPEDKVELLGKLILSKITLETGRIQNNRSDRLPFFDRESNPTLAESVDELIAEAIDGINEVGDIPQRGYALSFLAKALAQVGRFQSARTFVKNAEETACELADKREAISILLSLVPTLQSLNDSEATLKVYGLMFTLISDSYLEGSDSAETTIFEWRLRDSELDRVVRSLLEQNFLAEAVLFTNRIDDLHLRDRLLRAAVYIYMDQKNFTLAESTAKKIELPRFRTGTLRDLAFLQRRSANSTNHNENENSEKTTKPVEDANKTESNKEIPTDL
ncbi:MAG: hypothetical protein LBI18_03430 [Planctomycetaceae bacterium]|jgi:tetratricopeptide (TPR) repeat protein|nr:hypothetical protein [Planctomycetaceae bacterium]